MSVCFKYYMNENLRIHGQEQKTNKYPSNEISFPFLQLYYNNIKKNNFQAQEIIMLNEMKENNIPKEMNKIEIIIIRMISYVYEETHKFCCVNK